MPLTRVFCLKQLGRKSAKKMESLSTNRFQEEFQLMTFRLERLITSIIPESMQKRVLSTGSRRDVKRALNLPIMLKPGMNAAPHY